MSDAAARFETSMTSRPSAPAFLLGPLFAARRGHWFLFWAGLVLDTVAAVPIARRALGSIGDAGSYAGIALIVLTHAAIAFAAPSLRRSEGPSGSLRNLAIGILLAAAILPLTVYAYAWPEIPAALRQFPALRPVVRAVTAGLDGTVTWMTVNFAVLFDAVTMGVRIVLNALETLFVTTPWPVTALVLLLLAWRTSGWRVALFTLAALAYLGLFGFWEKAMSTMSLVATAAALCTLLGLPIGIWCAKSDRADAVLKPLLDLMQTMPSFVYLIPAIAFFSVGKPPAVLATVIFAMPPLIRLTALGIRQVPPEVREAMLAYGASPMQLLLKAELPLAVPSIMTGINQSIMMSLSMVVVAALIGAGGLGYDVLFALQHVETGKGVLAGLAIVLCAMVLDRIVQGNKSERRDPSTGSG